MSPTKDETAIRERLVKLETDVAWIKEYLMQHKRSKEEVSIAGLTLPLADNQMKFGQLIGSLGVMIYVIGRFLGWF